MGAVDPTKGSTMTTEHDDTGYEPPHTSSPTDHVLAELQLYGYRPFQDEPDPRPLPDGNAVAGAVADIFDAIVVTLADKHAKAAPFKRNDAMLGVLPIGVMVGVMVLAPAFRITCPTRRRSSAFPSGSSANVLPFCHCQVRKVALISVDRGTE